MDLLHLSFVLCVFLVCFFLVRFGCFDCFRALCGFGCFVGFIGTVYGLVCGVSVCCLIVMIV